MLWGLFVAMLEHGDVTHSTEPRHIRIDGCGHAGTQQRSASMGVSPWSGQVRPESVIAAAPTIDQNQRLWNIGEQHGNGEIILEEVIERYGKAVVPMGIRTRYNFCSGWR
jgi:hypothetical protein